MEHHPNVYKPLQKVLMARTIEAIKFNKQLTRLFQSMMSCRGWKMLQTSMACQNYVKILDSFQSSDANISSTHKHFQYTTK